MRSCFKDELARRRLAGFSQIGEVDACILIQRTGVRYQLLAGDVGCEMVEVRVVEFTAGVVTDAIGSFDTDMSGVRYGSAFNQPCRPRLTAARAGDCPGGPPAPALVPLAELVPVASPGHVTEVADGLKSSVWPMALLFGYSFSARDNRLLVVLKCLPLPSCAIFPFSLCAKKFFKR